MLSTHRWSTWLRNQDKGERLLFIGVQLPCAERGLCLQVDPQCTTVLRNILDISRFVLPRRLR